MMHGQKNIKLSVYTYSAARCVKSLMIAVRIVAGVNT